MNVKLLLFFAILPMLLLGQATIEPITKKVYLKEVHEVSGNQDALNRKATEWIAKSYNNSNYVTRLSESDKILVKGGFDVGATMTNYGVSVYVKNNVGYTLDLEFKDGRYKIEVYDVMFDNSESGQTLSMYLMEKEEYRGIMRDFYNEYDGPGKKKLLKDLENDKKFNDQYAGIRTYGEDILAQIFDHLNGLDLSLLNYMLTEQSKKEDW